MDVKPNHRGLHYFKEYLQAEKKLQLRQISQAAQPSVADAEPANPLQSTAEQLEQDKRNQVKTILQQIEQQILAVKLTSPVGDDALESYKKIAALDPANPIVEDGYNRLATLYLNLAKKHLNDESFDKSLAMAQKGLSILAHPDLVALKAQIEIKRLEKQRQLDKISNLLAKAESQFQQNKLVSPKGNNVYETLREVQVISPSHPMVERGFNKIADRFLEQARSKQNKTNQNLQGYERTLAMVNMGVSLIPKHQGLADYKTELEQKITAIKGDLAVKEKLDKQLLTLLAQAQSQVASGALFAPQKANAFNTYESLIQVAPTDPRVVAMKQRLVDKTLQSIETERQQGKLNQAMLHLDRLLAVAPSHEASRSLKKALSQQISEVDRIEATRQKAKSEVVVKQAEPVQESAPKVRIFGTF